MQCFYQIASLLSIGNDIDLAHVVVDEFESEFQAIGKHIPGKLFSPLDGDHRILFKDFLQIDILQLVYIFNPIQIHMKKGQAPRIFIDQSEAGTGDIVLLRNIEAFCQSLHKRCFAASEVTG